MGGHADARKDHFISTRLSGKRLGSEVSWRISVIFTREISLVDRTFERRSARPSQSHQSEQRLTQDTKTVNKRRQTNETRDKEQQETQSHQTTPHRKPHIRQKPDTTLHPTHSSRPSAVAKHTNKHQLISDYIASHNAQQLRSMATILTVFQLVY